MHMTRENKLALVVGFALILFVGILISDHFSTARRQASADLSETRPNDPLVSGRRSDPELLELRPPQPRVTPAVNQSPLPTATAEERPTVALRPEPRKIEMGGHAPVQVQEPVRQEQTRREVAFQFYHVQSGETLASICRKHYGDESLVSELAKFNDIANPNIVRVNHRLRIPSAEFLRGESSTPPAAAATRPEPPVPTTYTVQAGDSLSTISQQQLGTARRWREIHDMNRDVIRDPDNVIVGTVLKMPKR